MANRYDIIRIDFQASAKGANTAIESIRQEAEQCNNKITELKKNIAEAPKNGTDAKIVEGWNAELKITEKRFKQFSTAYKELIKGMRALDEGVKMFNDGSLSQMNAAFQKTVNSAAKLAQSKLQTGSNEWRQMGALMQETEQNYARMQRDTDQLIESLKNGGTVFRKTLDDEIKGLQDLMRILPYMGTEYRKAEEQMKFLVKTSDELIIKERQMQGEIVTTNDARRVSYQLTKEGAEAARQRAAAADEEIEKGKQIIANLEAEQKTREDNARVSAQAAAEYRQNQKMHEDEIERLEAEMKKEMELANSKKNGVEALKQKALGLQDEAETEKKKQQELDGVRDTAREKVEKLRQEYEALKQSVGSAPAKDPVSEAVKTGAEEVIETVRKEAEETKKKTTVKKEENQATKETTETKKEEIKVEEKVVETQKEEKNSVELLMAANDEIQKKIKELKREREELAVAQKKGALATKEEANAFADLSKEQAAAMLKQKQALSTFKSEGGKWQITNREEAQQYLFDVIGEIEPNNVGKTNLSIQNGKEKIGQLLGKFRERYGLKDDNESMDAIRELMSGGGLIKSGFMNPQFLNLDQNTAKIDAFNKSIKDLTAVINGETKAVEENVEKKKTLEEIDAEIDLLSKQSIELSKQTARIRNGISDGTVKEVKANSKLAESHSQNAEAIKKEIEAIKQLSHEQLMSLKNEMNAKSTVGWKANKLDASNLEQVQQWIIAQAQKMGNMNENGVLTVKGKNIDKLMMKFHEAYGEKGEPGISNDLFKEIIKGKGGGLFEKGGAIKGETLEINVNNEAYDARLQKLKAIFDITNEIANASNKSSKATKGHTDAIAEQEKKVKDLKDKWDEAKAKYTEYNNEYKKKASEAKKLSRGSMDEQVAAVELDNEAETLKTDKVDRYASLRDQYKQAYTIESNRLKKMQSQDTEETQKNTEAQNQNTEATENNTRSKGRKKKAAEETTKATAEETQKSEELLAKEKELSDAVKELDTAQKNAETQQKKTTKAVEEAEAAVTKADEADKKHVETMDKLADEQQQHKKDLQELNEANKDTIATNEKNQQLLAETNNKILEQGEKIRDAERIKAQAKTDGIEKTEQAIRLLTEENSRIDQNSFTWKRNTIEIQHLKEALDEMKNKPVLMMMERRMKNIGALSASAVTETRKFWEAMAQGADKGSEKLATAETHIKALVEEEQKRKAANAEDVITNASANGIGDVRQAVQEMERLRDSMSKNRGEWEHYNDLVKQGKEYINEWAKADAYENAVAQMQNLTKLTDSGLADARKYWETMRDGADSTAEQIAEAKNNIKALTEQEQQRLQNRTESILLGGGYKNSSEREVLEAIKNGKQLIETYGVGRGKAIELGEAIAKAEAYLKEWGLEASRAKVKQAELDDRMRNQFRYMVEDMNRGVMPSQSVIKAQMNYWKKMAEDPKTASTAVQEYLDQLKEVENMQDAMVKINGETAFEWFQNGSYKDASTNKVKEMAADLKAYRDTLPQETEAAKIQQIDQWLQKTGQSAKKATEDMMEFEKAKELALQAGDDVYGKSNPAFLASPEEIQAATKSIEKYREELFKTIKQKKDMGEATDDEEAELQELAKYLKDLKFEQDNFNMSREKMEALMKTPVNAVSLDELRAAIKRADGELHRMEGSLDKNSKEFKEFAAQVQNAKNMLKEMEGQAKASATAWEKAWSRLKTYVVMYMGFNAVWQKIVGTADDIMELSDKMGEVRKTTGFTADEVGRLSDKLAELDTRTGLTNLMSISAKAGQLGLKNMEDVMGFTEAANKLMVALPEMGEEAATQMMKVAIATGEVNKIQKEMDEGVTEGSSATAVALERIGSTIDQLRANSAAAAPQITDFVKRVGAVGAQSNISIDQVAALGSTVDALGMRVEMSATALSRMIPAIKRNAFEVAKAIGMAPNALRQMFDEAGGGMNAMLAIFQHIKDAGMNADDIEKMMGMGGMADIMKDLNQQGARAGIVFAGLSQNVDELRRQLGVAKTAYEENIAIQNEYDKMNETTAAKWERLSNKIEEMFVGDASQNALGVIIDGLRTIIDLITGPLSTAFNTTVLAVTAIKTGLTEIPSKIGGFFDYLKESAMKAGEELQKAANATGDIAKEAEGIEGAGDAVSDISDALGDAQEAGEQAGEAMETATGAIEGMTGATRVSIFSVKGLKTAWKGLDATMKANIIVAVVALLYTLGKALYNALTETSKYSKAVADANAMIQIAIDRFEGYWEKLKETAAALDRAKKSTEGLKEGSDQLTKATIDLTKADNAHKTAIADINSIYGKYLGFMLTEANYANLSAAAHDKVAAAIRREMLAKQQQAAIDQVTQENTENLKDGLANLTEELREDGRLNNQEAAKAKSAVQKFMRENIKFNTASGEYEVSQQAYQYLTGKGANLGKLKELNPNQLAAGWFYEYLKENFHLNDEALADITGVFPQGGSYRKTNVIGRNFRGDYASAYLDNMQDVAEVQDVFAGDLGDAQKEDRKATTKLVEKLKKQADAAKAKITNKSTSEKERNAAYEDLANALEGLDGSIDQLNPVENKTLIDAVKKQADDISKSVDKDKLLRARTNARSIFARATGSENGYTPEVPLTPESNPWGEKLGADSTDWANMTAEQLVNRRKQMKDFVNAIQTDSDVKTVLEEDAALKKAIKNGMSADMRTVIEWYNTERLKIQDELHARHLTNTGDWMDPKKTKARKKLLHDETKMFLDELDAYYTERKAKIQEAGIEEGITEAEMKNRTLANEAEWRQRRMELQKMYGDKAKEVTQKEQDAIFNIIAERTDDDVKVIKGLYQKTLDFVEKVSKMGEQGEKEAREFRAKMDKQAMQDLLKEQNAMHQQMKAIQDVIDKERPFNGITKNLRENLVTMGILTADMTEERNRLMAEGADMADFNARQAAEEMKRTAFMLGEAENAYTTTIEDIMKRMADAGMTAWADELKANPKMREALIAQLHQTYDDIQEAIKKEASLMKKQAENMWNNILLPGGDGKTTVKDAFEQAISQLGIDQGRVSRANSLIGAGAASERVADRLAIKQMKLQLTMQEHYFNLMRKQGQQRIDDLKRQADELERQGELEKASRVRQDKAHAEMSLRLATTKEQTELLKQQEDIIARTEESQNRLYKELKSWGDLLANSMRDLMEASNAGNAEYYNELAKLNLTGKGGPGAGTYIVIDNEGTSDATAHYEHLDERQALERQHEIEQENARAEAWKKVWDDLNAKMNEQITDWMNAALQNESIDANTNATLQNTQAMMGLTEAVQAQVNTPDMSGGTELLDKASEGFTTASTTNTPISQEDAQDWINGMGDNPALFWAKQSDDVTKKMIANNKKVEQSTQSTFAKMTAAANLYGIAYQTMSNDNLDASQKFELFALQAAGNAAIGMLTTNLFKQEADQMVKMPGILGELLGQMPYPVAMATYAAVTALMGGLMGMAVSKVAKSKSQIAQVTGASASAGRLATGMLTYAEGNVNEFTDPSSLTPGRQYSVDGRDGRTYRARYMGEGAKTHITNGPEFHLVGEKGREAIIDAHTTRNIQLNEPEIWGAIKTLYNGGSLRHSTRRRGVRAFADGNLDEFEMAEGGSMMAEGMDLAAVKDSLDRNSAVQEALLERLNEPIVAQNILYGPDGLPAILKKLQKEADRHGEKFL